MFILKFGEKRQGADKDLTNLVTQVCEKVVPRLIGDKHLNNGKGVTPVVCHGDLWSGNASRGSIGSEGGEVVDLVYDPSAVYGHSEYDLGESAYYIKCHRMTDIPANTLAGIMKVTMA